MNNQNLRNMPDQKKSMWIKLRDALRPDSKREAVFVHIPVSDQLPKPGDIEDKVQEALEAHRVGQLDYYLIDEKWLILQIFGDDADKMLAAILPVLVELRLGTGGYALKRYGQQGAREDRVDM